MNILGRIVALGRKIVAFQEIQRLLQDRPLAPRAAGVDLKVLECRPRRGFYGHSKFGQVFSGQQPVVLRVKLDNRRGNIALVESGPGRLEPGFSSPAPGLRLFVGHILQGSGQVGLFEDGARLWGLTAGQIDGRVRWPAPILVGIRLDDACGKSMDGKSVARKTDRGRRDLTKPHGSVPLQRGNPGVGRAGYHGAENTRGNMASVLMLKHLHRGGPWPATQTADRRHLTPVGQIQDDWGHAGHIHQITLQDTQSDTGSNTRVNRIATGLKNMKAGVRRQIVTSRDHVAGAPDGRSMGSDGSCFSSGVRQTVD